MGVGEYFISDAGPVISADSIVLLAIAGTQAIIAITLVVLRLLDLRWSRRQLHWDLILLMITIVLTLTEQFVCGVFAVLNGLGFPESVLTAAQIRNTNLWAWNGLLASVPSFATGKLAVLAMYLQIAKQAERKERFFLIFFCLVIIAYSMVQMALTIDLCGSFHRMWEEPRVQCAGLTVYTKWVCFCSAFSAFIDFALVLWPIVIVSRLQINDSKRKAIYAVMGAGLIPCALATGRAYTATALAATENTTDTFIPFIATGVVEQWMVIILTLLPPLRTMFVRSWKRWCQRPKSEVFAFEEFKHARPNMRWEDDTVELKMLPSTAKTGLDFITVHSTVIDQNDLDFMTTHSSALGKQDLEIGDSPSSSSSVV